MVLGAGMHRTFAPPPLELPGCGALPDVVEPGPALTVTVAAGAACDWPTEVIQPITTPIASRITPTAAPATI